MALKLLGALMPLTYGAHAMREVMIRGGGMGTVAGDPMALAGFAVVFLVLNTIALRKLRRL